jgi:hypothetical protein
VRRQRCVARRSARRSTAAPSSSALQRCGHDPPGWARAVLPRSCASWDMGCPASLLQHGHRAAQWGEVVAAIKKTLVGTAGRGRRGGWAPFPRCFPRIPEGMGMKGIPMWRAFALAALTLAVLAGGCFLMPPEEDDRSGASARRPMAAARSTASVRTGTPPSSRNKPRATGPCRSRCGRSGRNASSSMSSSCATTG